MILNDKIICNVCMLSSDEDEHAVFMRAHKGAEAVDICTSCVPSVIHGSGMVVKSAEQIKSELGE